MDGTPQSASGGVLVVRGRERSVSNNLRLCLSGVSFTLGNACQTLILQGDTHQ